MMQPRGKHVVEHRARSAYHKCTSAHSKDLVSSHKRKSNKFQYVTAVIRTGSQSEIVGNISPQPAEVTCTVHRLFVILSLQLVVLACHATFQTPVGGSPAVTEVCSRSPTALPHIFHIML